MLKQIPGETVSVFDNRLCHNDIKCNNILMTDNSAAILTDFGSLTSTETKIKK